MSCKSSEEIVSDKTLHLFSIVCASFELQFQTNKQIKKNTYFFDVIYNPLETPFLKLAKLRSKNCINGLEMNKLQAMLAIKKVMKNLTSLRKIEKSLLKF